MRIDLHKIENLGIGKVLKRGTAEILERDDDGIFLYDTVSGAYMISSIDSDKAASWIHRHSERDYKLLAVTGDALGDYIKENYAFRTVLKCYQLAYLGEAPELPEAAITVRHASAKDLHFILENYDLLSEADLRQIIQRQKMIVGELDGKPVGFFGEHLEGSMGVLYVLPEYRNRGFAEYLEKYQIREWLKAGDIPFGQVTVENEKSIRLQKKLGFTEGSAFVYWFF